MKLIESFGKRTGYLKEVHVAFIVRAKYQRRAGAYLDIFVEEIIGAEGVRSVTLRENGTAVQLDIEYVVNKEKLYELITNQLL